MFHLWKTWTQDLECPNKNQLPVTGPIMLCKIVLVNLPYFFFTFASKPVTFICLYLRSLEMTGSQRYTLFLASAPEKEQKLSKIPMVREYPNVFPEDILEFPPRKRKWVFYRIGTRNRTNIGGTLLNVALRVGWVKEEGWGCEVVCWLYATE